MVNVASHSAESIHASQLHADPAIARVASKRHPPCVFAGTTQGLYVFDTEPHLELAGNSITALATNPKPNSEGTEATELWAIVDRKSVWHRSLRGEWSPVVSEHHRRLNCLLSIDEMLLVGTSEAHLLQIQNGNIRQLDSFDQAEGRGDWYTPWGGAPDVRSLATSSSSDLYVNVHVGGILRLAQSTTKEPHDQGQAWQPTLDLHADVHEVKTIPNRPNFVVAATAQGLAWSEDRGESWQFDRDHLHASYARAIAVCDETEEATILMSVSLGPHGGKAALYRRLLHQPGTFQKCHQGLPEWFSDNINTGCLTTLGNWVVFGTETGQIFRSYNAGLTWEQIASGLAPIHCLSLASSRVAKAF
jgi:hypothetical protein